MFNLRLFSYIKQYLGGASSDEVELLKQENEKLKQRIKELEENREGNKDKADEN